MGGGVTKELHTSASPSFLWRMSNAVLFQVSRSIVCPPEPTLEGKRALVTGGNNGIGLGTCRGLLERNAEIVMASRNAEKATAVCEELMASYNGCGSVSHSRLDLGDLRSVRECVEGLEGVFDIVVCNAGVWPTERSTTAQGHEVAFGTNVLGHFHLLQVMMEREILADNAVVIILTGDIYCTIDDCDSDYRYSDAKGCKDAYSRSKLGSIWIARELHRRHPSIAVRTVHPGVVATNLTTVPKWLTGILFIGEDLGAQTTLYSATQEGIPNGSYLHNVLGIVALAPPDPAADDQRAAAMWDLCEELCQSY
mmetsp:Transcript_8247/g.34632  ORF Transcript_8247/g.34632 Transcript_8247/m.34632 type:complete len:310 (-) Transcript_8247:67-996(-)